ncbi:YgaP family membrane protein [Hufsiella ginkgonis]|uniref:DUF2892 domain-containing protein n=1 Tax=Hufsiella ginkgonis TaxID=2695274 RepID=A0A7K1Y3P1_9SPHI|nr:DUF2892 domain-containing protein [Hufsiella ginkgonis]MXV17487.1 DUF2892 domain-containing protein [Hufsiella ginkgonis]
MDTSIITEKLSNAFNGPLLEENEFTNVSKSERILSIGSGSFIFVRGITNLFSHPMLALGELALGGFLVHRGVTGQCKVKPMIEQEDAKLDTVYISVP